MHCCSIACGLCWLSSHGNSFLSPRLLVWVLRIALNTISKVSQYWEQTRCSINALNSTENLTLWDWRLSKRIHEIILKLKIDTTRIIPRLWSMAPRQQRKLLAVQVTADGLWVAHARPLESRYSWTWSKLSGTSYASGRRVLGLERENVGPHLKLNAVQHGVH